MSGNNSQRASNDRRQIAEIEDEAKDINKHDIKPAQDAAKKADAKLKKKEDELLQADKDHALLWGPVTVNSDNGDLLTTGVGTVIDLRVHVNRIDANVTRSPDGATWAWSSGVPNTGAVTAPTAQDDSGFGAIPAYVETTLTVFADDITPVATTAPSAQGTVEPRN